MINAAAISRAAICCAAALVLMLTVAGPATAGKPGKSGKPKVTLLTTSQSALTDRGKVEVRIKSKRTLKAKLSVALKQGGEKTAIARPKQVRVQKGTALTAAYAIKDNTQPLVRSCLGTHLHASITYKLPRPKAGTVPRNAQSITVTDRAWRKRDPSQCDGRDPVGVEVDTADRCDPIAAPGEQCLFPYPNDFYTRPDSSTPTGLRLDLRQASMPANVHDVHVDPAEINTSDGFSPGAPIVLRVPGMDTPAAFAQTGAVPITDMDESFDADQPVVLIDAATGQRQLIWTELDSNTTSAGETDLEIHVGKNLLEGHRYIVALRGMKDSDGNPIDAPAGFQLFRDGIPTGIPAIENRRDHFEDVFDTLGDAGIDRDDLYMAWDFTVASTENITGRMLSIRDQAFADLGDTDLTDGGVDGSAPQFTINPNDGDLSNADPSDDDPNGDGPNGIIDFPNATTPNDHGAENIREVTGTVKVPCYMTDPDDTGPKNPCDPGAILNLDHDGVPVQNGFYNARFTCNIPRSAVDPVTGDVDHTVRTSMYGHGLFGDYTEVHTRDVRTLGNDHGVMTCATDFIGMSEDDQIPLALPALQDLSKFKPLPDRLQQGFLDFLYLGRAMIHPGGFASNAAFKFNGTSVIDTSKPLFYYGNSQGGIAGGALTAVATDFTRSVLYVPGMSYATLLPRSVDFNDPDPAELDFASILYPSYPDESSRPLLLSLIQSMWDRGEPNGYANHMTTDPLPNTPEHKVLIEMAYGDHQVANVTTAVEARTIGAPLRMPAVDANRIPAGFDEPFAGLETLGDLSGPAANGSGYYIWDIGPKRLNTATPDPNDVLGTDPPPITNTPPPGDEAGIDPHDTVIRQTPAIRAQIAAFLDQGGKITDPPAPDCGPHPCYAAGWTGAP